MTKIQSGARIILGLIYFVFGSMGLAIAFGMYALGILTALIIFGLLSLHHCPGWARLKAKMPHSTKEDE